jgi:hypothetical protein
MGLESRERQNPLLRRRPLKAPLKLSMNHRAQSIPSYTSWIPPLFHRIAGSKAIRPTPFFRFRLRRPGPYDRRMAGIRLDLEGRTQLQHPEA